MHGAHVCGSMHACMLRGLLSRHVAGCALPCLLTPPSSSPALMSPPTEIAVLPFPLWCPHHPASDVMPHQMRLSFLASPPLVAEALQAWQASQSLSPPGRMSGKKGVTGKQARQGARLLCSACTATSALHPGALGCTQGASGEGGRARVLMPSSGEAS